MYRFTDHFLVPVGVSMYADSAVFCPIDTHPPIYPNPAIFPTLTKRSYVELVGSLVAPRKHSS